MQDAFALQRSMSAWRRSRNALLRSCLAAAGGLKGCEPLEAWAVPCPCRILLQESGCVLAPAFFALFMPALSLTLKRPAAERSWSCRVTEAQGAGHVSKRSGVILVADPLQASSNAPAAKALAGASRRRAAKRRASEARRMLLIRLVMRLALPRWQAA